MHTNTMSIPLLFSFLLFSFVFFLHPSVSSADSLSHFCDNTGNYTANNTYATNLNQILSSLPTNASRSSGFSKSTFGSSPNMVSALALCRGDTNSSSCRSCLDIAIQDAAQLCPFYKSVTIYYDLCLLRYSNQIFLSSTDNSDQIMLYNTQNVSNPTLLNGLVGYLLNKTADSAAYNSSDKLKYSTAQVAFDKQFPTIYGLEQCTPDLTDQDCRQCLEDLVQQIQRNFGGRQGARILGVRCNVRYEVYTFYVGVSKLMLTPPTAENAPAPAPAVPRPVTPASPGEGKKKNSTGTVLAIVIPIGIALSLISLICLCFWRKRRSSRKIALPYGTHGEEIENVESLLLDLSTLRAATDDFAEVNKLGEGGFGAVYKDGQEIAVKRLSKSSGQGVGELKNELMLVAKLQHKNLVRLLGVCLEEQEKLLVYEFVPNRSLDTILFDDDRRHELDWGKRYKIINGVARGLLYLHEDSQVKIVHRDLKASNILLDADMSPKISDFGLARLFGGDQTQGITSRVVGTFGYMAPEYAMLGHISIKSDVFSFGVLVLEILTGRRNSGYFDSEQAEDLLSFTWEHWTSGTITEVMDPSLGNHYPRSEMLRCIHIGLLCVQEDPADRPSMSTVVVMLSSETVSLEAPVKPAFCVRKSSILSDIYTSSSDTNGNTHNQRSSRSIPMSPNEVSITELEPR
ncbi:cysteine-rich receptor-like protein kinase 6 isoform X2 [Typha angustifolia]|uniref:cysteine-rich receptor-like protein kinase 6 isoform X2 n=1 Tax=Typha angustifolia TaxID=59011 RepID=UPI003C2D3D46